MNRRLLGVRANALIVAAVVVVLFALPFYLSPYNNGQITLVLIFAVGILGLNLIAGYTGQLTVAQSFFIGIGGYAAAILTTKAGFPPLLTIPVAGLVGFVLSWLVAVPVLRLRGFYLMVVTLALVFVLSPVLKRFDSLTGGATGLAVKTLGAAAGLADDQVIYLVALIVAVVLFAVAAQLVRSPYGPAMVAVRDREQVAEVIGIDSTRLKTRVFAMAGLYAGTAGGVYALAIGYVSPDSFGMLLALSLFAGAFLGGISTISGAAIGAVFVQFVPRLGSEVNESLTGVIFGAAVIVCMLLLPSGIAGVGGRLAAVAARRGTRSRNNHPSGEPGEGSPEEGPGVAPGHRTKERQQT